MADWQLIGFEDGAKGYPRTHISERRKACADHGVVPDKTAYDTGYEEGILTFCSYARGLQSGQYGQPVMDVCPSHAEYHAGYAAGLNTYCTYARGHEEGLAGSDYHRVCPRDVEQDFLLGYEEGYHVYDLTSERDGALSRLEEIAHEQEETAKQIEDTLKQIAFDETLTGPERAARLVDVESLRKKSESLTEERTRLELQVAGLTDQLAELGYK